MTLLVRHDMCRRARKRRRQYKPQCRSQCAYPPESPFLLRLSSSPFLPFRRTGAGEHQVQGRLPPHPSRPGDVEVSRASGRDTKSLLTYVLCSSSSSAESLVSRVETTRSLAPMSRDETDRMANEMDIYKALRAYHGYELPPTRVGRAQKNRARKCEGIAPHRRLYTPHGVSKTGGQMQGMWNAVGCSAEISQTSSAGFFQGTRM